MKPLAFNELLLKRERMVQYASVSVDTLAPRHAALLAALGADDPVTKQAARDLEREVEWQEEQRTVIAALKIAIRCTPQPHDGTEEQIAQAAAPHEEALAKIYGCLPSDIWEACERLRADKVSRED